MAICDLSANSPACVVDHDVVYCDFEVHEASWTHRVRLLDDGAIGNGVTERYSQLDDVGATPLESEHQIDGSIASGKTGRQEVDQDPVSVLATRATDTLVSQLNVRLVLR